MRVFGRAPVDEFGNRPWMVVETDPNGNNDYVYLTALVQALKLNLGESPFWGNYGIPAYASVQNQIAPDTNVNRIQRLFAPFFASLTITKVPTIQPATPTYQIFAVRNDGSTFRKVIAL